MSEDPKKKNGYAPAASPPHPEGAAVPGGGVVPAGPDVPAAGGGGVAPAGTDMPLTGGGGERTPPRDDAPAHLTPQQIMNQRFVELHHAGLLLFKRRSIEGVLLLNGAAAIALIANPGHAGKDLAALLTPLAWGCVFATLAFILAYLTQRRYLSVDMDIFEGMPPHPRKFALDRIIIALFGVVRVIVFSDSAWSGSPDRIKANREADALACCATTATLVSLGLFVCALVRFGAMVR